MAHATGRGCAGLPALTKICNFKSVSARSLWKNCPNAKSQSLTDVSGWDFEALKHREVDTGLFLVWQLYPIKKAVRWEFNLPCRTAIVLLRTSANPPCTTSLYCLTGQRHVAAVSRVFFADAARCHRLAFLQKLGGAGAFNNAAVYKSPPHPA